MTSLRSAYLFMLTSAASFSVMSFVAHTLRDSFSWQVIATVRTAIALALSIALARHAGASLVFWRPHTLWIRSLAGSVALLANFYSMTHYPVSEVLALCNMFPLWVAILSWPVLGERPRLDIVLAAIVGVFGVYVLQQHNAAESFTADHVWPVATALTASLASAVALLGLHHLQGIDTRAVVAHFSGVSLVCSGIAMLVLPGEWQVTNIRASSLALLAIVGVAGTCGQLFLTKAFVSGPPAQISVIGLTQVGFAMVWEMLFTQRRFDTTTLLGLALIVTPTAWVLAMRSRNAPPLAPVGDDAGIAETSLVAAECSDSKAEN